jgi:hypothetical protein
VTADRPTILNVVTNGLSCHSDRVPICQSRDLHQSTPLDRRTLAVSIDPLFVKPGAVEDGSHNQATTVAYANITMPLRTCRDRSSD